MDVECQATIPSHELKSRPGELHDIANEKILYSGQCPLCSLRSPVIPFFFGHTTWLSGYLSSLTRDSTLATAVKTQNSNHWPTRELPSCHLFNCLCQLQCTLPSTSFLLPSWKTAIGLPKSAQGKKRVGTA